MMNLSKKEFQQIFKDYYQMLCRFAYIIVQCKETADEIVQKTFITLWEKRNTLIVKIDLKSYLYISVKNMTFNYLKSLKNRQKYESEYIEIIDDEEIKLNDQYFKEKLMWAIAKLPEKYRAVYCMKYMEGLTYEEIANYLEISTNTVDNHIQKALKLLKGMLYQFKQEFYSN